MGKIAIIQNFQTIILANGAFPEHNIPLLFLKNAERIICCDGSAESLLNMGMEPDYIVGDLDSLPGEIKQKYASILYHNPDQETNDLTKAVHFCVKQGWTQLTILGATGKREDHSLGNISLLVDYAEHCHVQMLTDYGVFIPILKSEALESFENQQISLFSITPETIFTISGFKYPLNRKPLQSWWQGTLNEALSDTVSIGIDTGKVLVFREYSRD